LFCIEWVDFGAAGLQTNMAPKIQTKPENARVGETLQMHPLIANGGIGVPSGSDRSCRQFNKTEVCNEYVHKMGCTLVASQFYLFRMDLYCRALRRLERWWTKR
jgi:hypothetical protein